MGVKFYRVDKNEVIVSLTHRNYNLIHGDSDDISKVGSGVLKSVNFIARNGLNQGLGLLRRETPVKIPDIPTLPEELKQVSISLLIL